MGARMLQSIALGGHHVHELTAARHERGRPRGIDDAPRGDQGRNSGELFAEGWDEEPTSLERTVTMWELIHGAPAAAPENR